MEPIRVLQVVTIMNRGGLETMLMNYYRKIDRSKIQFDFMVHRSERGHYDDEIEKLGGKIYRMIPIRPGNYHKYFGQLDKFFREHKEYKVIHSHMNENSAFVLKAAKKANIPCRIAHNHVAGLGFDYKFPFRVYARLNLKNNVSDKFACSDEAAKWLFGKASLENGEVTILKNGVDLDNFKYDKNIRKEMRKKLNVDKKLVLGHVGRFSPSKNHKFLIDVFNEICKERQDVVLLLVGDGEERKNIELRVNQLGLSEKVKFLGLRNDIYNLMQAMDIFIFPSFFEALPVVLVEAQATGLKCIVSTGVPREANILGNVEFLDLNAGEEKWRQVILKSDYTRNYDKKIIEKSGYDINDNIELLTNFYLEKYIY